MGQRIRALGRAGHWHAALALLGFACAARQQPSRAETSERGEGTLVVLEAGTPEFDAFLERIRHDIVANREQLIPIFASGDIAQMTVAGEQVSIEPIGEERAQRIAFVMERDYPTDTVSPRWFRRRSEVGRIFLIMGRGTLLINVDPKGTLSFEPGSLGAE